MRREIWLIDPTAGVQTVSKDQSGQKTPGPKKMKNRRDTNWKAITCTVLSSVRDKKNSWGVVLIYRFESGLYLFIWNITTYISILQKQRNCKSKEKAAQCVGIQTPPLYCSHRDERLHQNKSRGCVLLLQHLPITRAPSTRLAARRSVNGQIFW